MDVVKAILFVIFLAVCLGVFQSLFGGVVLIISVASLFVFWAAFPDKFVEHTEWAREVLSDEY